jgi:predicted metalloprotease
MKWSGRRESDNVEISGGMGRRLVPVGGMGTIILGLALYFLTGDPSAVLNIPYQSPPSGGNQPTASYTREQSGSREKSSEEKFVAVVLADTEDVWSELFHRMGRRYREPKLVLFSGQVESACGITGSSVGPFYCPSDQKLYLDLDFFRELDAKFGAPGDFAQAYVIAHEVGHHVQNLLGTMDEVHAAQRRADERQANQLSVRVELQADYYAGVWAHYAQKRGILDPGDVEEALNAASAVGDDRLQQEARGYVVPDSFTHGSSEQRAAWFGRGFRAGDIQHGNTFDF